MVKTKKNGTLTGKIYQYMQHLCSICEKMFLHNLLIVLFRAKKRGSEEPPLI